MEKSGRRVSSRSCSSLALSMESPTYREPNYVGASCDEKRRRNKKLGYENCAAKSNMAELMRTPAQFHQSRKKLDSGPMPAAGVGTERLTMMIRGDNVTCVAQNTGKTSALSGCRQKGTDPITHRKASSAGQCLLASEIDGAAGQTSTRLTAISSVMNACVSTKSTRPGFKPPPRTDLISHAGDRGTDAQKVGLRRFPCKGISNVPLEHSDKQPYTPQTPAQIQDKGGLRRQKEVPNCKGGIDYSMGGDGNTLPAATKAYNTADMKASRCRDMFQPRGGE